MDFIKRAPLPVLKNNFFFRSGSFNKSYGSLKSEVAILIYGDACTLVQFLNGTRQKHVAKTSLFDVTSKNGVDCKPPKAAVTLVTDIQFE